MPTLEELLVAIRRKLLASDYFAPLIGTDVGTDSMEGSIYSGAFNDGWVMPGVANENKPLRDPEATGTSTVTYHIRGPWTSPNQYNTLEFPMLVFTIFSDQSRISTDNSLLHARDAELRCDRVARAIKDEFNDKANRDHNWPNGVYVGRCELFTDLVIRDVPGSDGLVEGDLRFSLQLG